MKKQYISCLNCGIQGHTTKVCNYPITSYGLICFKKINNEIKYIMIQKKDSLCYTEFLRGKYEINNLKYMGSLFDQMTMEEKQRVLTLEFSVLWKQLWNHIEQNAMNNGNGKFQKEYNKSYAKFCRLKTGFYMERKDGTVQMVDLKTLIANSGSILEQQWEFPKGRRKLHESDVNCAMREFYEEVGIKENIVLYDSHKQFEEIFQGSNGIRYRNVFYIAQFIGDMKSLKFDSTNQQQAKEVRDVNWFTYDEALKKINVSRNPEKRELFKRINTIVHKKYL